MAALVSGHISRHVGGDGGLSQVSHVMKVAAVRVRCFMFKDGSGRIKERVE